jgi:hypothetical protein
MKGKILAVLKTKFDGVQDAILVRVAEKIGKTVSNEDEIQGVVDGVTFQQVLESYGDSRATEATRSSIANYESKHNLKDGKPAEIHTPPKQPGLPDDAPQWAKDLAKLNADLASKLEGFERKETGDRLAGLVKSKLKEKGVKDSFFLGRNISVESEEQVDQAVETMFGYWDALKKDSLETDIPPRSFSINPGAQAVDADIDNWAKNSN